MATAKIKHKKTKKRAKRLEVEQAPGTTYDEVIQQLASIRLKLADADLPAPQHAKLVTERRQWLSLKSTLEDRAALQESKVCEHPKVQALIRALSEACADCPKCFSKITKALE